MKEKKKAGRWVKTGPGVAKAMVRGLRN